MFSSVIGKLVIREDRSWNNVGAHFIKKKRATIPSRAIQDVRQDAVRAANDTFYPTLRSTTCRSKSRIESIIGRSDGVLTNILDCATWDCSSLFLNKMRADIVPGAIFPDYELSDHT